MELLPAELRASLPALYTQEKNRDPTVHLKFFTPDSNWTWFATEGEAQEDDFLFFGYVCVFEEEWGYFVLSELSEAPGPLGHSSGPGSARDGSSENAFRCSTPRCAARR